MSNKGEFRIITIKEIISSYLKHIIMLFFLIIISANSAFAGPLIMLLNNTYQDNTGAGSIDGAYGMQIDETRKLAFISSTTDDYLTAINFSIPSSLSVFGSVTDSAPVGSLDGIRSGTLDTTNYIFYAPSGVDSATSWYNVSAASFVFLNDTAADTGGAGSQQGEYDVVYVDTGATRWLITGGLTDDYVSSFDVTNSRTRPAVTGSFTDSVGACSVDAMTDLYNIPGTSLVVVAVPPDDRVTVLNVSDAGAIACLGSGYTDSAGAGSIDGIQHVYYEPSTQYLYVTSPIDGYLTILENVASGTPTLVGSVSGLTTPVSVAVSPNTFHGTKYAFVSSTTAGYGIRMINITDPTAPTLDAEIFNQTSGTCIYNSVYSLNVVENYLYATSSADACFYAIELKNDSLTNITLSFPYNNYYNDVMQYVNLTFNATVSDNDSLVNCSLWTNYSGSWLLNQTQDIGGVSNITSFNLTGLSNRTFAWNIQCFDIYSNFGWANTNRTVALNWSLRPLTINSVNVDDNIPPISEIVLSAGSTRFVNCTVIASDSEGAGNIVNASATFHYYLNKSSDPDDNTVHYTNASCDSVGNTSLSKEFLCGLNVFYYANNGSWYCNSTVNDADGLFAYDVNSTTINPLYALNITDGIDFGNIDAGDISFESLANITNIGNMLINVSVLGYARAIGDNYAMNCSDYSNISISSLKYSVISSLFSAKTGLSSSFSLLGLTMTKTTSLTPVMNNTFWQLQPDPGAIGRECTGYVIFSAEVP